MDSARDGLMYTAQGSKCDAVRAVAPASSGKRLALVFKSRFPRERRWVVAHETSSLMSEGSRGILVVSGHVGTAPLVARTPFWGDLRQSTVSR